MKHLLSPILFILAFNLNGLSQMDTFNVTTYYNHYLTDKAYTYNRYAVMQITMDPNGKKLRTFFYDEDTKQMKNFIYFFYPQKNTIVEEHFAAPDSLLFFRKIQTDGLHPLRIEYLRPINTILTVDSIVQYTYEQNRLTEELHLNNKGKKLRVGTYTYTVNGNLSKVVYQYTKQSSTDIYKVEEEYLFESNDDFPSAKETRIYLSKKDTPTNTSEKYTYFMGLLTRIDFLDSEGKLIKYQENKYLNNELTAIDIKKPDNQGYLQHQVIGHKEHIINFGNRPSYYESYQTAE